MLISLDTLKSTRTQLPLTGTLTMPLNLKSCLMLKSKKISMSNLLTISWMKNWRIPMFCSMQKLWLVIFLFWPHRVKPKQAVKVLVGSLGLWTKAPRKIWGLKWRIPKMNLSPRVTWVNRPRKNCRVLTQLLQLAQVATSLTWRRKIFSMLTKNFQSLWWKLSELSTVFWLNRNTIMNKFFTKIIHLSSLQRPLTKMKKAKMTMPPSECLVAVTKRKRKKRRK